MNEEKQQLKKLDSKRSDPGRQKKEVVLHGKKESIPMLKKEKLKMYTNANPNPNQHS